MRNSSETPYFMILFGLALFGIGMVIDVTQHGLEFLISEFRHAPLAHGCLLYTSPSPRDRTRYRMPSSA